MNHDDGMRLVDAGRVTLPSDPDGSMKVFSCQHLSGNDIGPQQPGTGQPGAKGKQYLACGRGEEDMQRRSAHHLTERDTETWQAGQNRGGRAGTGQRGGGTAVKPYALCEIRTSCGQQLGQRQAVLLGDLPRVRDTGQFRRDQGLRSPQPLGRRPAEPTACGADGEDACRLTVHLARRDLGGGTRMGAYPQLTDDGFQGPEEVVALGVPAPVARGPADAQRQRPRDHARREKRTWPEKDEHGNNACDGTSPSHRAPRWPSMLASCAEYPGEPAP